MTSVHLALILLSYGLTSVAVGLAAARVMGNLNRTTELED